MSRIKRYPIIATLIVVAAITVVTWLWRPDSDLVANGHVSDSSALRIESMKRLNPMQFEHIIHDLFGDTIKLNSSLVAITQRDSGLLELGAGHVSLSPLGVEVAEELAAEVARQVVSEPHRSSLIPCQPESETAVDKNCAEQFITSVGRLLFRRPLTELELRQYLQLATMTTGAKNNFYAGLERSLMNMLVSPQFLFRIEYAQPDGDGDYGLTDYAKATRLSFLLWDSSPDGVLLTAAERGDLRSRDGLQRQVDRMLLSPRVERGVRQFFTDMFGFDRFETLIKDSKLYPDFSRQVARDAREQTLRTVVSHLLTERGDYRDLFITPKTFLTPLLAAQLEIPLVQNKPNAMPDQWQPYEFEVDDPRVGLLAQPAFVALHSHPGRTSPTLRGKALREHLLCQEVPAPPGDVDFTLVQQDGSQSELKTMRQRLSAHAVNPTCAGCHKITDPIGLALENFDTGGRYREQENGVAIDSSGDLDGIPYSDPRGLGIALHDNPHVVSCLVQRVFAYGTGREPRGSDRKALKRVGEAFAKSGYQLPALLRLVAISDEFYGSAVHEAETVAGI